MLNFPGVRTAACALVAVAGLLLSASTAVAAVATSFTVSGTSDGNTGTCGPTNASGVSSCGSLRAAVAQANAQGNSPTITLGAGTYQLTGAFGGELSITKPMTINGAGPGGAGGTTIEQTDGDTAVIAVMGASARATLSELEITGGHQAPSGTTGYGGGIFCGGSLDLQHVLVTGNEVDGATGLTGTSQQGGTAYGGGIDLFASGSQPSVIEDSSIVANKAIGGGGANDGTPSGSGGEAFGGGVFDAAGSTKIIDSTIADNQALGGAGGVVGTGEPGAGALAEGGGYFDVTGGDVFTGDTLTANRAQGGAAGGGAGGSADGGGGQGGGLDADFGDTFVNSTLFANTAAGGSASGSGSIGEALGGGVATLGGVTLASSTVVADVATGAAGSSGGNLQGAATLQDTVVARGSAPLGPNCDFGGEFTDLGHNLVDDSSGNCDLSPAKGDQIDVNAQLAGALASDGGPTQTLAPAPGSPVIGNGGQCLDPTSSPPGKPLTVDQRGLPRTTPCDIGAFQAQAPVNSVAPAIAGPATAGSTVSCKPGTWSGDLLSYAYAWALGGSPIGGATAQSFKIPTADAHHALTCTVTASHYGTVSVTSAAVTVVLVPPTASIAKLRATSSGAVVTITCKGSPGQTCAGTASLLVRRKIHGKRRQVTVASVSYSIATGGSKTLTLTLGSAGRKLLARSHKLSAQLLVTQRSGAKTVTIGKRGVTIRSKKHRRK